MAIINNLEEKLRQTSPEGYAALSIFTNEYVSKAKQYERIGREVLSDAEKVITGRAGEVYSDGVHKAADWGGKAAGCATAGIILAAGAAIGSAIAGPIGAVVGAWLVSGVAGAVGGAVNSVVSGLIEAVGRGIAGLLGIDFHSSGKTPGGGTWERTDYGSGGWSRHEDGPSFNIDESMSADGAFTQTITGKGQHSGYKSHFTDKGKGGSRFEAEDTHGGKHSINSDESGIYFGSASSNDTDKTNGKSGKHVSTSGPNGVLSDLWFYPDGSSKETHTGDRHSNGHGGTTQTSVTTEKDKDGNTTKQESTTTTTDDKGNTTTQTTTTDEQGKSETKTESTDKSGHSNNPPQPPPDSDSGRDNPDGSGTDRAPFRPGEIGKGRPGHPMDELVIPGSWKKDNGEWEGEQPPNYRDVLAGMAILLNPHRYTGYGDASDEEAQKESLFRKLQELEIQQRATGEDFIHPKAKAGMMNKMMRSVI